MLQALAIWHMLLLGLLPTSHETKREMQQAWAELKFIPIEHSFSSHDKCCASQIVHSSGANFRQSCCIMYSFHLHDMKPSCMTWLCSATRLHTYNKKTLHALWWNARAKVCRHVLKRIECVVACLHDAERSSKSACRQQHNRRWHQSIPSR